MSDAGGARKCERRKHGSLKARQLEGGTSWKQGKRAAAQMKSEQTKDSAD
jgi:hypothetical protein